MTDADHKKAVAVPLVLSLVGEPARTDDLFRRFAVELAEQDYQKRYRDSDMWDGGHQHDLEEDYYDRLVAILKELASGEVVFGIRQLQFDSV